MADTGDKQWFQKPENKPNKGKVNKKNHNNKTKGAPVKNNGAVKSAGNKNSGSGVKVNAKKSNTGNKPVNKPVSNNVKPANSSSSNVVKAKNPANKSAITKQNKKNKHNNKYKNNKANKPAITKEQKKPVVNDEADIIDELGITSKTEIPKKDPSFGVKQRKRAKRKTLPKAALAVVVSVVALLLVYFSINYLFNYIAAKPEFMFVSNGSVEHTIGARAIIVRDESVVTTKHTGDLVTSATEGGRVSKGQAIAMVVPEDMASTVEKLRNTQNQISEVQQELIADGKATGADAIYDDINENIAPIVNMIRLDSLTGNMSSMSSYSSSISVLITQRENMLSDMKFEDERLNELRNDEASYERMLENSSERIFAPEPGIISYKLDGLEESLSFDYLMTADPDTIDDCISSSVGAITSDLYINDGEPVARIAKNEKQYLAVFLDHGEVSESAFEVGTLHTLNISSEGISIARCMVERSVVTEDGILIVFSTTRYVEDLLDLRTVDIEIVITETIGLKVPTSALVKPDYDRGVATIYVNKQGFAEEVSVLIIDNDREFAIISPIGDETVPNTQTVIITNPSSIKPGDKVTN